MAGVRKRLSLWLEQLMLSVDQLAYVLIAGPIYVLTGGPCPNCDETISSRVGRAAVKGHKWGLALEWVIDRLFWLIGVPLGHCRRAIEKQFLADQLRAIVDTSAAKHEGGDRHSVPHDVSHV